MLQIHLNNVQVAVQPAPGAPGMKLLIFVDPQSGIQVIVPLDEATAKNMAAMLTAGIVIASGPVPKNGKVK